MESSAASSTNSQAKPFSVLFVCLGNICGSPAAEDVFRDLIIRVLFVHKIGHISSPSRGRGRGSLVSVFMLGLNYHVPRTTDRPQSHTLACTVWAREDEKVRLNGQSRTRIESWPYVVGVLSLDQTARIVFLPCLRTSNKIRPQRFLICIPPPEVVSLPQHSTLLSYNNQPLPSSSPLPPPPIAIAWFHLSSLAMATKLVVRQVSRRFSSGSGKILSEEEKAAENVYIKKLEQEKLEKLARKGPKPEEKAASGSGGSAADVKPSDSSSSTSRASTDKVSTDKYRNYAVVAGAVTALGALGWYLKSGSKKTEEVRD